MSESSANEKDFNKKLQELINFIEAKALEIKTKCNQIKKNNENEAKKIVDVDMLHGIARLVNKKAKEKYQQDLKSHRENHIIWTNHMTLLSHAKSLKNNLLILQDFIKMPVFIEDQFGGFKPEELAILNQSINIIENWSNEEKTKFKFDLSEEIKKINAAYGITNVNEQQNKDLS
jgi:hypothetical protein